MGLHLPPHLALFVYIVFILGLLWLDCRRETRVSRGLWVPTIWIALVGSRPLILWFSPGSFTSGFDEGSPLGRAVYSALILAGLLVLSGRKEKFSINELVADNKALFLLLGYFALSIVWSDYPFVSFKRYIKMLGMLIMIVIILTEADPAAALRTAARRSGFVLLPLSLLLAKYFPSIGVNYDPWTGVPVLVGVATDKNMLGQICMVLGLFYLWDFMSEWKKKRLFKGNRLVLAIDMYMLLLAMHLLLLSHSATSLVCMLFGVAILLATRYASVRNRIGLYIVVGSISFLFLNWFSDIIPTMIHALGRKTNLTGRTGIWKELLPYAKQNLLFGSGYETFWTPKMMNVMGGINEAHNGYLETVLNTGLVGLFFLSLLIISAHRRCKEAILSNPEYGRFAVTLFFTALVYNFTEAAFRGIDIVYFLFIAISLRLPEPGWEREIYGFSGLARANDAPPSR